MTTHTNPAPTGTATIVTTPVTEFVFGRTRMRLREGTNSWNAIDRAAPYIRRSEFTYTIVGTVLVVASIKRSEPLDSPAIRARLNRAVRREKRRQARAAQ